MWLFQFHEPPLLPHEVKFLFGLGKQSTLMGKLVPPGQIRAAQSILWKLSWPLLQVGAHFSMSSEKAEAGAPVTPPEH